MSGPWAVYPEAGDVVHMVRGGTPIRVEARVAEGGQGIVYRGRMDTGTEVAIKWYRPGDYADHQRRAIGALTSHARAHPAFAWPTSPGDLPSGSRSLPSGCSWTVCSTRCGRG
jgi:hypothetical protein